MKNIIVRNKDYAKGMIAHISNACCHASYKSVLSTKSTREADLHQVQ
jgi:hypothetical protein